MTFHGVDYIVVPVELLESVKEAFQSLEGAHGADRAIMNELYENIVAYEDSNEPTELTDD